MTSLHFVSLPRVSPTLFVALLASLLTSTASLAAGSAEELGLELVPYAKKIGERRYQSQRDYDATIKFFRDKFKGSKSVRWTREVSLPAVKYVHLENTNSSGAWEGVNIYQLKSGEVRFYVLPRTIMPVAPTPLAPAKTTAAKPAAPAPASTP